MPQRAACGSGDARGMQVEGRDTGGMWQEGGTQEGCSRREGHRRDAAGGRDTGGMQQEGGTQEGCSRREGHGTREWDNAGVSKGKNNRNK